jgi:hypothetical protein
VTDDDVKAIAENLGHEAATLLADALRGEVIDIMTGSGKHARVVTKRRRVGQTWRSTADPKAMAQLTNPDAELIHLPSEKWRLTELGERVNDALCDAQAAACPRPATAVA